MGAYSEGQKVKAVKNIDQPAGAAWPGHTGRIVKKTGDGYVIRWDHNGGFTTDIPVKDHDIERA